MKVVLQDSARCAKGDDLSSFEEADIPTCPGSADRISDQGVVV